MQQPVSQPVSRELANFSDGRKFNFSCTLTNGETMLRIPKDAISELIIEDTAVNWFARGYIDVKNPDGALENSLIEIQNSSRDTYVFRNDAKDFLSLYMMPNISDNATETDDPQDDFHMINYLFAVYSVKDMITGDDTTSKTKRLYFIDARQQSITNHNNSFTTSAYLTGAAAHLPDEDRKFPTGQVIQWLLDETLPGVQKFAPSWEMGVSMTDYTSPANNTTMDDLQHLVSIHVSDNDTNNTASILHLDRTTSTWSLLPISTIFQNAVTRVDKGKTTVYIPGMFQTEQFTVGSDTSSEEMNMLNTDYKTRVPHTGDIYINYNLGTDSCIQNYRFVEMHGDLNQKLLNTRPVHQYNNTTKRFTIDMVDSNTSSITHHLKHDVLGSMMVDTTIQNDTPMSVNVDHHRFQNLTIQHIHTWDDDRSAILSTGRNQAVKDLMMQSNAIEFTVPGQPARRSCRFISVAHSDNSAQSTRYNDKVDGQYFTIAVIHKIKNNMYTNKVIGIKPYNFNKVSDHDQLVIEQYTTQ